VNNIVPVLKPDTGMILMAFVVTSSTVLFHAGSRVALVSAVDLDVAAENSALKNSLEAVLGYANTAGTGAQPALPVLAWTTVKVLCFDDRGMLLAPMAFSSRCVTWGVGLVVCRNVG
jgi:hypothetical protein